VQSAFGLAFVFPPPAAGAFRFARCDSARAGRAADGEKAAGMQFIDRYVVRAREVDRALARPVVERVDLDQAVRTIETGKFDSSAMLGLVGAQAGDPTAAPSARG